MKSVIVIPARYDSTRFPGKPLKLIAGQTLLSRVWKIAKAVPGISEVLVATDDKRIADHVLEFGGRVVMTSSACRNGTERVYEAVTKLGVNPEIVINLQGDTPLTPPWFIQSLLRTFESDAKIGLVTPAVRLSWTEAEKYGKGVSSGGASGTFVTFSKVGEALYFSKYPIPFIRNRSGEMSPVHKHIGIYGFRFETLKQFLALEPTALEEVEGLEQLRALENGMPIKVVLVERRGRTLVSVDTPHDVEIAEAILAKEGELL